MRIIRRRDAAGVSAFTILLRLAGGVVGARVGARPRFSVLQAGLDACLCVQLAWYSPPLTRVRGVISAALEPLAALARRGAQRLRAYRRRSSYARVPTGEGPPAAPSTTMLEDAAPRRRAARARPRRRRSRRVMYWFLRASALPLPVPRCVRDSCTSYRPL